MWIERQRRRRRESVSEFSFIRSRVCSSFVLFLSSPDLLCSPAQINQKPYLACAQQHTNWWIAAAAAATSIVGSSNREWWNNHGNQNRIRWLESFACDKLYSKFKSNRRALGNIHNMLCDHQCGCIFHTRWVHWHLHHHHFGYVACGH